MDFVPVVQDLSLYSDPIKQKARYSTVERSFLEQFNGLPSQFFARAPGRVNLIGEHIDYCHFSVLPMAIEVDVIAAVASVPEPRICIANTNKFFSPVEIPLPELDVEISINKEIPSWADYFKCGLVVARKYMLRTGRGDFIKAGPNANLRGLNAMFNGTVPTGGGLSSSAAFCIASSLAVLWVNGVTHITKADLTDMTVVCEHYVGLSNGGMDQSASINGEDSKMLLISFKPKLSATAFEFPVTTPETVFLISNSLVTANKTQTAPSNYNLRVVEVAIAADIIAEKFGLIVKKDSNIGTATLRGVFDAYFLQIRGEYLWDTKDINLGITRLEHMLQLVDAIYNDDERNGISVENAKLRTGTKTIDQFHQKYLSHYPTRFKILNVYKRTRHVYSDSLRVLQVLRAASRFDGNSESFLTEVGGILEASQASTRDYNEASTWQCDELCVLGKAHGSYGSRVTGAGFGGCIVHLTTVKKLPILVDALVEKYYKLHFPKITQAEIADAVVISKPVMGACIIQL